MVSFVTDMAADRSECVVLDARNLAAGPVARILLPHRISSGTHSCWARRQRDHQRLAGTGLSAGKGRAESWKIPVHD